MRTQQEIEMLESLQEQKKSPYVSITSVPPTPTEEQNYKPFPTQQGSPFDSRVHRWWLYECTAWIIASLSLVGIVILLSICDRNIVPDWTIRSRAFGKDIQTRITINAVISLFSTVLKSCIMIPVAAAMSQLKWLWFYDGNRLSDVQLFDGANRGPLGSVILIWKMRGR